MENETLQQIAQLVIQGMVSSVFIYAWSQERKERQELIKLHSLERDSWMKELIDLAREAYGLKARSTVTTVQSQSVDGHKPQ